MKPYSLSSSLTGSSKEAIRRRVIPKILKNESQKVFASACSRSSSSNSFTNSIERFLISFQLRAIKVVIVLLKNKVKGYEMETKLQFWRNLLFGLAGMVDT